jgi:hypothetical protein
MQRKFPKSPKKIGGVALQGLNISDFICLVSPRNFLPD